MKLKPFLITAGILGIILILIPIVIFVSNFHSYNLSIKIEDWGALGSFFGGIIQPIISLFSLAILGYITFLVSKVSSKENLRINILQRRFDAFEKLSEYLTEINALEDKYKNAIRRLAAAQSHSGFFSHKDVKDELSEILGMAEFYSDYHSFLHQFRVRYGHVFEQRFDNQINDNLTRTSEAIKNHFYTLYDDLMRSNSIPYGTTTLEVFKQHEEPLMQFILNLRGELGIDNDLKAAAAITPSIT